ncbi:hypothetical protein D3C85_549020 [compost metagenome]
MISRLPAPPARLPLPAPPMLPAAQGFVRGFVASACLGVVQEGGLAKSPQQVKRLLRQALLGGTAMAAGSQVAATIGRGLFGRALLAGALGATAMLLLGQLLSEATPQAEESPHD